VFARLEPFAKALWRREIADYGDSLGEYTWAKRTFFGGLYQKAVATRGA